MLNFVCIKYIHQAIIFASRTYKLSDFGRSWLGIPTKLALVLMEKSEQSTLKMKLKRFLFFFVTCLAASFGLKQVLEILIGFDIAFPCNALLNSIKDVLLIFLYLILDKTLTSKFMQNFCDD